MQKEEENLISEMKNDQGAVINSSHEVERLILDFFRTSIQKSLELDSSLILMIGLV